MLLIDTLSRVYVSHVCTCSEVKELEEVNHTLTLALTPDDILHLQYAAEQDQAMQELHQVIQCGWPSSKAELPDAARPYFDFCDQLIVQDQLIFRQAGRQADRQTETETETEIWLVLSSHFM